MIEVSNLQVRREGQTICQVNHLQVDRGERVAIAGLNGSGKTTLLKVLAGLTSDDGQSCRIEVAPRQRTYVHQHPLLFRSTVLENVSYAAASRGLNRATRRAAATEWLDRLGVGDLAERGRRHLSGGEVRRIALARALAFRPALLLLDEPLAELDDASTQTVCEVLGDLPETTLVIATPIDLPAALPVSQSLTLRKEVGGRRSDRE